ncbi:MAG: histidinol-phosphate transaminase [Planctomycetes bacterium]|nr:histidinol-phosphate transaminase [Planctomycetota bacterium]
MAGYVPGEQLNDPEIIKLNTNENPYPPSPRVFDAIRAALTSNSLRKYPQPLGDTFRKAAGRVLNVDPDAILIGNGSDDILTILTRAFVPEGGLIASPTPSYILYKSLAEIQGARFEAVRFGSTWAAPTGWPPRADLVFLPNPNSPSGTSLPSFAVHMLANALEPRPLVLDEAYSDFAEWNGRALLSDAPNLIITRTLSKSYALAGIRFGFAIARPEIVRELVKVKDSYNCDVLSLAAATAAIEDQEYFREVRAKIIVTRERMTTELSALGFDVTPSHANFLWCRRTDRPVKPVYEALKQRKILVRYMSYPAGPVGALEGPYDGLRISVGTDAEIDQLLASLRDIL